MYERADDMKLNFSPKTAFYRVGDIVTRVQSNEVEASAPGHQFNIMGTSPTPQPQQYQTKKNSQLS